MSAMNERDDALVRSEAAAEDREAKLALQLDAQRLDFAAMLAEKVAECERHMDFLRDFVDFMDTPSPDEYWNRTPEWDSFRDRLGRLYSRAMMEVGHG